MMMNTAKKDELFLKKGTRISGKWKGSHYTVIQRLGSGMVGTVYLCRFNSQLVALKISEQQTSMTVEVNALNLLNEVQDGRLEPFLFEVDDWVSPNQTVYSFYAMEYIPGTPINLFTQQRGVEWLIIVLLQLFDQLHQVHEAGFVFGDIKTEHILIEEKFLRVRCIDVGGTTKMGRSIKEYSEFYDRAYWQLGTRKAEPSYDLFAIAMIVLSIYDPQLRKKIAISKQGLLEKATSIKELHIIQRTIQGALLGKFPTATSMKNALLKEVLQKQDSRKKKRKSSNRQVGQSMMIMGIGALYYVLSLFV